MAHQQETLRRNVSGTWRNTVAVGVVAGVDGSIFAVTVPLAVAAALFIMGHTMLAVESRHWLMSERTRSSVSTCEKSRRS